MMRSDHLHFKYVQMKGKYSFQYIEDSVFENCVFDTKDAFWHAKNIVVRDSIVRESIWPGIVKTSLSNGAKLSAPSRFATANI